MKLFKQNDYKRIIKNLFKLMNKKIYIKDIKKVEANHFNFAYGLHHNVTYTITMKTGEIYELEVATLDKYGNYSRYSGDFRPVRLIKK